MYGNLPHRHIHVWYYTDTVTVISKLSAIFIGKTEIDLINATFGIFVSDGIYYKLKNSTIYPLTSTMHLLPKLCYGVHVQYSK